MYYLGIIIAQLPLYCNSNPLLKAGVQRILICLQVHLKLLSPDGVTVVPTQDSKHLQKLCVGSEETRTVTTVFVFSGLGSHTLSGTI